MYLRLHGTPRVYYSSYEQPLLRALAARLLQAAEEAQEVWCILDNTASGAAAANALELLAGMRAAQPGLHEGR